MCRSTTVVSSWRKSKCDPLSDLARGSSRPCKARSCRQWDRVGWPTVVASVLERDSGGPRSRRNVRSGVIHHDAFGWWTR
jgi:hypothetical protein